MKPYYEEDGVTIYLGDCRELLPDLDADTLLTDPPYGIGIASNPFRQRHERSGWDAERVDPKLLERWIIRCTEAIVWGGNYFDLPATQRFLVWDKGQGEDFSSAMCEVAWTNLTGPAKLFKRNVWQYRKSHPTQKPVELMRWCLEFSALDGVVLDPFMGSGTTLVAAKEKGRPAIGIEIEERYCEIAVQRLSQGVLTF